MARIQLGLTDEEFYALTPRQFHLLVDQHRDRTEHQELLAGIIASTVANWSGRSQSHMPAKDFMPMYGTPPKVKPKRVNRKQVAQSIRDALIAPKKI